MTAEVIQFPCRYVQSDGTRCKRTTRPGMTRCDEHVLSLFRRDPEPAPVSPWVRLALAGKLPPSAA